MNSDPKKKNEKKKKKKKNEFEFCKVCKLNHDQGPRHKYFPRHKQSLSTFLDRFKSKIADVGFFLKNPSVLRPEYASRNRVWCVFCDEDIVETDSFFACSNAINHLASDDHLKNLKHFLWKHGGAVDCADKFRILQTDVSEWEKKCRSLKHEGPSSSKPSNGLLYGPSNDIQNELEFKAIDKLEPNPVYPHKSNHSDGVMPLHYNTYEYQIPPSGPSGVTNTGTIHPGACSYPRNYVHTWNASWNPTNLTVNGISQQSLPYSSTEYSGYDNHTGQEMYQEYKDGNQATGVFSSVGSWSLTPVSSLRPEGAGGNVHSGAPPPWLDPNDGKLQDVQPNNSYGGPVSVAKEKAKSCKLNPKRVGAAWAEKRKMELEMEKRGEITKSDYDADWLPNFGRVWQSGSRKESRKEFENEKQKSIKVDSTSEPAPQIQPYISKRMRRDDGEC